MGRGSESLFDVWRRDQTQRRTRITAPPATLGEQAKQPQEDLSRYQKTISQEIDPTALTEPMNGYYEKIAEQMNEQVTHILWLKTRSPMPSRRPGKLSTPGAAPIDHRGQGGRGPGLPDEGCAAPDHHQHGSNR